MTAAPVAPGAVAEITDAVPVFDTLAWPTSIIGNGPPVIA